MSNLLPLDTWFDLMGFNHWHAWGFADSDSLAVTSSCNPVMFEDASQGYDAVGRVDIREAIESAENQLYNYLNYWPAPKYYEMEVQWGKLADKRFWRYGPYNADWSWKSIILDDGWVLDCGVEGLTAIQIDAPVSLLDINNDGYYELFQIGPIATTLTDVKEIAVYFASNERWDGTSIGDKWRVQPIQVFISGGYLTIQGRPWLIGRPELSQGINPQRINPVAASSFAATLDVYRRFVNRSGTLTTNSQGVIRWETRPCHGWWCCCSSCCGSTVQQFSGAPYDPRSVAEATARVGIRDSRRGIVTPAEAAYNSTTGVWSAFPTTICWEPDRVLLRLYAGFPLDTNGWMDKKFRDCVARLAAAELQQAICGCAEAERRVYHWQQDLSKTGADKETFAISSEQLNNPLGTRRGHWWAWNMITNLGRVSGLRV